MIFKIWIAIIFSSFATGETFIFSETYRTFKEGSSFQTNTVWAQQDFGRRLGGFAWGQVGRTYQQTYGGFFVRPTSWLQAGIATGQEQLAGNRLGSFAFANKGRYHVFAIYEDFAKTGYWYYLQTDARINKKWSVGSHHQAFMGHGPRVERRLKSFGGWTPSIRLATVWNSARVRPNVYLGLRFSYFKGD